MTERSDHLPARWIRIERADRSAGITRGMLLAVVVWLGLVGLHEWLVTPRAPVGQSACLVRAVTGVPCPTCGSTRSVLSVMRGDFAGAFSANPFVFVGGIALIALATLRIAFARRLTFHLPTGLRRVAWAAVILLFLGNWAYIVARDGPFHRAPAASADRSGLTDTAPALHHRNG